MITSALGGSAKVRALAQANEDAMAVDLLYVLQLRNVQIFNEMTGNAETYYQKRSMNLVKLGNETKLRVVSQPAFTTEYTNAHFV